MAMAVSPAIEQRFPVSAARVAIKSLLAARFKGAQAYSTEHTKALADEIRDQMKALGPPRYRYFVHVVVGESKQQGLRIATRSLWDGTMDALASESYHNEVLFAVATVFAVYSL